MFADQPAWLRWSLIAGTIIVWAGAGVGLFWLLWP
jgi:hypothetical protein